MRMAIVEVIGSLIRELATSEDMTNDSNQTYKQLDGLFELLISRTLDLSSYVRSKVLTTLSKMLDVPVRLAKQRLRITRAAVDMLEDKASTVRKAAVSILVKLILTHPYGEMYGGDLNLQKWEERYKAAKAKLQEMEGVVGKAVEKDGDEDEDEEDEDEEEDEDANAEEEDEADGPKKTSKKCATFPNLSHSTHNGTERPNRMMTWTLIKRYLANPWSMSQLSPRSKKHSLPFRLMKSLAYDYARSTAQKR